MCRQYAAFLDSSACRSSVASTAPTLLEGPYLCAVPGGGLAKGHFLEEGCQWCRYTEAQETAKFRRGALGRRARDRRIANVQAEGGRCDSVVSTRILAHGLAEDPRALVVSTAALGLAEDSRAVRYNVGDVAEVLVLEGACKDTWLPCHIKEVRANGTCDICVLPTTYGDAADMSGKSAQSVAVMHLRKRPSSLVSLCPTHVAATAAAAEAAAAERQQRLATARAKRLREAAWVAEVARVAKKQEQKSSGGCFAFSGSCLQWLLSLAVAAENVGPGGCAGAAPCALKAPMSPAPTTSEGGRRASTFEAEDAAAQACCACSPEIEIAVQLAVQP